MTPPDQASIRTGILIGELRVPGFRSRAAVHSRFLPVVQRGVGNSGTDNNEHRIRREGPSHRDYAAMVALDHAFVPAPAASDDNFPGFLRQAIGFLESEIDPRQPGWRPSASDVNDVGSLRRDLRALLTVRLPAPLPPQVHTWVDAILQHERRASREVDAEDLPSVSLDLPATWFRPADGIALWQGDITNLRADAIVNAANAQLLGCFQPFHACIDNAIHWAAGPRMREDCGRIMAAQGHVEATGLAKITRAYNLPARFALHTVGPIVRGHLTEAHRRDLARCYRTCLDVAAEVNGIRTLAFCAISTGIFGFPKLPAAVVAVDAVAAWIEERPGAFSKVVFVVFSDEDRAAYTAALTGRMS
jgi:O-acetyl-ADP-ribose deacetylase (regulator of RNase III)